MRINHISTFLICAWTKLFSLHFLYERNYRRKDEKNCIVIRFAYMQSYIEIQTTRQNSKMSHSYEFFIHSKTTKMLSWRNIKLEVSRKINTEIEISIFISYLQNNIHCYDASKKICVCQTLVKGHLLIFGILRQDFCNF